MPEQTDHEKLNPRRRVLEIGTRRLREITLWPLSFCDQMELKNIIIEAAKDFFINVLPKKLKQVKTGKGLSDILGGVEEVETMEYLKFFSDQIENNLEKVLGLALDDEEDPKQVLKEIDNVQLSEIVREVFERNFLDASKNVKGLVKSMKTSFQLTRPQQPSADGTDIN